ncbi:MAG: hypothetical protein KAH21_01005, partial [Spirochaetaceae bacterium]|nr:hypothetical protein [Spirochaetaceae bacterium]
YSRAIRSGLPPCMHRMLRVRGLVVQPFKSGPDYIDPGGYSAAAELFYRNLETRMLDEKTVYELFRKQVRNADITVVKDGLFLPDRYLGLNSST